MHADWALTRGLATFLLFASPAAASAAAGDVATGTLTGRVVDVSTQKPLPFTNIAFYRVTPELPEGHEAGGVLGQKDGSFTKALPPGTYRVVSRYISYERGEVRDVVVRAGEVTAVSLAMAAKPITAKTVQVTGQRVHDKETALLDQRKKADVISDAISSEQIAKSTDSNAAEAMERVTGVSVVDGKYVYVRGMGERYSATQVNGSSIGTPEPNKRVVPLDLFPTGSLDNVVVQKTYTPDMEGEFGGGVVSINTKTIPAKRTVSQALACGVASGGSEAGFMAYDGGRWDAFGFDDGTRDLPGTIEQVAGRKFVTGGYGGLSSDQMKTIARSFKNTWTPRPRSIGPSLSYSGVYADRATLGGHELGYLVSASLANGFETSTREDNEYYPSTLASDTLQARHNYRIEESSASVLGGLVGTLTYRLADDNILRLHTLYTRQTDDEASISQGPNEDTGVANYRRTQLAYVERGLLSVVASGERPMIWKGSKVDWNASYSRANRSEPDRRVSVYESLADGTMALSLRTELPSRVFGESVEYDRAFKVNWLAPMTERAAFRTSFKSGFAFRDRNRTSGFRRFAFRRGPGMVDLTQEAEVVLGDANLASGAFQIQETTNPTDRYVAEQEIGAAYGMFELKVHDRLRFVAGARFEQSGTDVLTRDPNPSQRKPPVRVMLEDDDVLPAWNATWNITSKMNLRAAYSLTLARPELRELSPIRAYNYETNYFDEGNTSLVTARLRNWDLRWEAYPGLQELVAVSLFRKNLDRPIEKLVKTDVGGNYTLVPFNAQDGEVSGVEAEVRTTLAGIWRAAAWPFGVRRSPGLLEHWGVTCNYTRVQSRVRIALEGADRELETPLSGQSSHAANVGLYFGSKRLDAALLYKEFGDRLAFFGGFSALPDVYETPPRGLDFTFGWNARRTMRLKFSAENLLDEDVVFRQRDAITQRYSPGRKLGLSASYKL